MVISGMDRIARRLVVLVLAAVLASLGSVGARAGDAPSEATWEAIRGDLFAAAEFLDGAGVMRLEAPYRAEDAAVVPIAVTVAPDSGIGKVTLVIDENPAPMAAAFTFGPAAASPSFSSRFRINSYSWVRAIGETGDGRAFMVKAFVKASGGCSAPALKDADDAVAAMGRMKLRFLPSDEAADRSSPVRQAQIMVRHPNYSGLQMDQVSLLYIPAMFLDEITVSRGGELVVKVEGGISLSENPSIGFSYRAGGSTEFSAVAHDTADRRFTGTWAETPGS